MINPTSIIEVTGDLEFEDETPMEIDPAALALILKNLVQMYPNPYQAVLQEYTSNADDAHVAAGQTRAVEVTTPNAFSPELVIQDWGTGMTRDELRRCGQFGASSKRETNDQVGHFGLGFKSGLAIAMQFTVTSVKDGFKNIAVIGKKADGRPFVGFLDAAPEPTDEPNGTTVRIPTNEVGKFQDLLDDHFFLGYPRGRLLVNGQQPDISIEDDQMFVPLGEVGYGFTKTTPAGFSTEYRTLAFIGPVRYYINWASMGDEVPHQLRGGLLSETALRIPMGSVEIAPSRDSLIYDKRTRKAIKGLVDGLIEHGRKQVEKDVLAATTRRDALLVTTRAQRFGFSGDYTWNGEKVEIALPATTDGDSIISFASIGYGNSDSGYSAMRDSALIKQHILNRAEIILGKEKTFLVHSVPNKLVKRSRWASLAVHSEARSAGMWAVDYAKKVNQSPYEYEIHFTSLTPEELGPWFLASYSTLVSGEDYKSAVTAIRREAAKNRRGQAPASVSVMSVRTLSDEVRISEGFYRPAGSYTIEKLSDVDTTKEYILIRNLGDESMESDMYSALMTKTGRQDNMSLFKFVRNILEKKYTILLATKTMNTKNYEKALTLVPLAQALTDTLNEQIAALSKSAIALYLNRSVNRSVSWMDSLEDHHVSQIVDPNTRKWVELLRNESPNAVRTVVDLRDTATRLGLKIDGKPFEKARKITVIDLGANYPLLRNGWGYGTMDEKIHYINLIDADRKKKKAATQRAARAAKKALADESAA